jgi:glucokinase
MTRAVLALDIGGTTVKGAVIDETGRSSRPLARATFPAGGPAVLDVVGRALDDLAHGAVRDGIELVGAGVATPGVVDEVAGRVEFATNLGWRDVDLRSALQQRLGVPVAVGHDVRTAGAAEALLGAGHGAADMAFVALGTGIAAALVTGGRVVTGGAFSAGEVGHMPVHPHGRRCGCGQVGCLEMYASAAAIAGRYAELGGDDAATAEDVAAAVGADPVADQVWSEAVEALALGLTTVTMMLDPTLVVLGGGVANAGDRLLEPLRAALTGLLAWRRPPDLTAAVLGAAAGRIGAGMLAFRAAGHAAVVDRWTPEAVLAAPAASGG